MDFPGFGPHYTYDATNDTFVPAETNAQVAVDESIFDQSSEFDLQSYNLQESPDAGAASEEFNTDSRGATPVTPDPSVESTSSDRKAPGYVRRPRNAFMIFRSEFWAMEKIDRSVEHDHRHISRIIAHYWNKMSDDEKQAWRIKAEEEKIAHLRKHPGYRFKPTAKTKKPVKRRVKRNGEDDLERSRRVADLLMAGKEGEDLKEAVEAIEKKKPRTRRPLQDAHSEAPSSPFSTASSSKGPGFLPGDMGWNSTHSPMERTHSPLAMYDSYERYPSQSPMPSPMASMSSMSVPSHNSSPYIGQGPAYPYTFFHPYTPMTGMQTSAVRSSPQPSTTSTSSFSPHEHYSPHGDVYEHAMAPSWANTSMPSDENSLLSDDMPPLMASRTRNHKDDCAFIHPPQPSMAYPTMSTSASTSSTRFAEVSSFQGHVDSATRGRPTAYHRIIRPRSGAASTSDLYSNVEGEAYSMAQGPSYTPELTFEPQYYRQSVQQPVSGYVRNRGGQGGNATRR